MTSMGFWGFWMMLLMPLFWVLVIGGAIWLIVRLTRPDQGTSGARTSLRVLEDRLARGEIEIDEFRARRAAIAEGR